MKNLSLLLALLFTFPAFALNVKGTLGIDGETWKFEKKIEHNKEYVFPLGTFIFKMTLKPEKQDQNTLVFVIQEKKGSLITEVTEGEEEIKTGENRELYAKGKEGQPGSIITIKVSK